MAANGYAHPEVLVETEWVAEHLNDPGLRFVEADEDILLYEQGHIPGAVKLDWHADLQNPVERDFVDKAGFEALMSRWGIANDTTVVFYGDRNNWYACLQLLALQATTATTKAADHERRPGEVGGRGPAAHPRRAQPHRRPRTPRRSRMTASARSATTCRRPSATAASRAGRRPLAGRVQRREAPHGGVPAGGRPAGRPRPRRAEHPLGDGRQRGRHLQVGRRAEADLRAARASPATSR